MTDKRMLFVIDVLTESDFYATEAGRAHFQVDFVPSKSKSLIIVHNVNLCLTCATHMSISHS